MLRHFFHSFLIYFSLLFFKEFINSISLPFYTDAVSERLLSALLFRGWTPLSLSSLRCCCILTEKVKAQVHLCGGFRTYCVRLFSKLTGGVKQWPYILDSLHHATLDPSTVPLEFQRNQNGLHICIVSYVSEILSCCRGRHPNRSLPCRLGVRRPRSCRSTDAPCGQPSEDGQK